MIFIVPHYSGNRCISGRVEACGLNEPIDVSSNIKEENPTDNLNYDRGVDSDRQSQNSISSRIAIVEGDITQQQVDAIVNSTDPYFSGSGFLDNAIQRAAGSQLREACLQLERCNRGEAKITSGYNLPARWVIHTVGPSWRGGNRGEDEILVQCYRNCLTLAEQYSIRTIAFPGISTGLLGFPIELASKIAVSEVERFLKSNTSVEKVVFVCFEQKSYDCYLTAVKEIIEGRGVEYTRLRDLLASGEWKEADLETKTIILQLAGRKKEDSLRAEDIGKLLCSDLQIINQLWVEFSNGRFGFSVQKQIFFSVNKSWYDFGDRIGWVAKGAWIRYDRLNFTLDAPQGHLPLLGMDLMDIKSRLVGAAIVSKLTECNIQ